jgi:hypothetical protein
MSLNLPVQRQTIRGSRFGGSPSVPPQRETKPQAAESRQRAAPGCDFCGSALRRGERYRLVWESAALATDLVLAELCGGCATERVRSARSRSAQAETIRLVHEVRRSAPAPNVASFIARGASYLLIALTFFLIVTLISSYAH